MAYNTGQQGHCSTYISNLGLTTGAVKTTGVPGLTYSYAATATLTYAAEAGECIAMVRVPRGFTVTDAMLTYTATAVDCVIGLGDPFACGRLLGPLQTMVASGVEVQTVQGTHSCVQFVRLAKIGRGGDGCGFGYTYTCETDLVVTVGYGAAGFGVGGSTKTTGAVSGGFGGAALPAAAVLGVKVEGFIDPLFTSRA